MPSCSRAAIRDIPATLPIPTGVVVSVLLSAGSRPTESIILRHSSAFWGSRLFRTRYDAYRAAMFLLRLVAPSAAGRRPRREYTPTAVGWYGARASNQPFCTKVMMRRMMEASLAPGETLRIALTSLGRTTVRGKLPLSKSAAAAVTVDEHSTIMVRAARINRLG